MYTYGILSTVLLSAGTLVAIVYLVKFIYSYWFNCLSNIPGPSPPSWWLGHLGILYRSPAGVIERQWYEKFGHTWRVKGICGKNILMTADPKIIQFVWQTSGYTFERVPINVQLAKLLTGPSILWAQHEDHKRHRSVMLPAFGTKESRALTPVFRTAAIKLCGVWKDRLAMAKSGCLVLNMPAEIARATLDAIGHAAFDYDFGAIEDKDNELANIFQNLFMTIRGLPSKRKIFAESFFTNYFPASLVQYMKYIPSKGIKHMNKSLEVSTKVAQDLVARKNERLIMGKEGRDVMSLLVKSNASEIEQTKLSDEEVYAQMNAMMVAGNETTSTTLTWTLWELARHPEIQAKLRAEIVQFSREAQEKGLSEIPVEDYEKMVYTTAVMKETIRFHTPIMMSTRVATRDAIIPLSKPIQTTDGQTITQIPVTKGTSVFASYAQYNRLPEIWGPDSYSYNPDRWLGMVEPSIKLGPYNNLGIFGAGIHACIGWRFAIIEYQTFLIQFINDFTFEMTEASSKVRRTRASVMLPLVEGEEDQGCQLPLLVKRNRN
ncbi:cytochrome P450 [Sistotremastrum niveocremeum HHB9708]|uniref:Cytochrome P450 n=2 Tax=Sistotremastraceae TaxID=3402574 RepID=A0A164XXG5_9AGAM|nr:cytochrome P450 [Sistotremastrum niveocremeum HHB9708]KZT35330.1 cytochrome P450 [Sistotremastrum suecicum HHB10207 ss-3]